MSYKKKSPGIIIKILCLSLIAILALSGLAMAEEKPITVFVDGEKLEFDAQPKMVNDRVVVPMRAIFEKLGAEVLWDPLFERVIVNYNESDQLIMHINEQQVFKNGGLVYVEVPPFISEARTYVPLRFISETLGQSVEWSEATYSVYIVPEHKGMEFIPFGEFLTIPCPYSVNRNYGLVEYDNKTDIVKTTFSLNGESVSDFERYSLIMNAVEYKTIKEATDEEPTVIYYNGKVVVKLTLPDEEGIFTVEIYSDASGETIKEYLKGETENE